MKLGLGLYRHMLHQDYYAFAVQTGCTHVVVHLVDYGRVPQYRETFIDDGEIDMIRVLSILHRNGFDGVLIPDHTPQITCDAPWHAGMAHSLGFMRAALIGIERASEQQLSHGR